MDPSASLKSLTKLYGDVSKAIYFNRATESTNLSFDFFSRLWAQKNYKRNKDKMHKERVSATRQKWVEKLMEVAGMR